MVGYSGNLGVETVLSASERLRDDHRIVFLTIGGGHRFNDLADGAKARGLEHMWRFRPYQEREALNLSLCVPDLHWISLKPALEGLIVPSKFYGVAAAGRPIAAIAAPNGDIARLVREHGCGIVVAPGDADGLASALSRLADDPTEVLAMGRRARAMLDAQLRAARQLNVGESSSRRSKDALRLRRKRFGGMPAQESIDRPARCQ